MLQKVLNIGYELEKRLGYPALIFFDIFFSARIRRNKWTIVGFAVLTSRVIIARRDVKGWKEQTEVRDLIKRRHGRRINFADARRDGRVISEAITRIKDIQEG